MTPGGGIAAQSQTSDSSQPSAGRALDLGSPSRIKLRRLRERTEQPLSAASEPVCTSGSSAEAAKAARES
eukprot:3979977-Pleurochrysis_carterae.AAC.1